MKKFFSLLLAVFLLFSVVPAVQPSAAETKSTAGQTVIIGDVDHDEKISSADARLALRGSVGLEEQTADFVMYHSIAPYPSGTSCHLP